MRTKKKDKGQTVVKLPKPISYQKDIINWVDEDNVKFITFLKSRQSGGSFLNKLLCSKWALENNNCKIGYVTPTLKLSKLFYKELSISLKPFITKENASDLILEFNTGTKLQFFSSESKDSIRGFQFHYLIVDEAAFMSDDFWNYILRQTILITGRKILMCSTPNGAQGFFHQYCGYGLENQIGYKTKSITIYDNPFVSEDEIKKIKSQVPERVFRQEFLAEFLDGSGSVFTNFKNCIVKNPNKNGQYFAGIDWAKQDDYTVLTIMNSHKQIVYRYRINGMDYTNQVKIITSKLNEWKPILTLSEENNIGTVVNELLKKEYKGQLKTITLDNSLKKEIIESLIVAFEQGTIGIDDDEIFLRELQAFTCTYNPQTQNIKYSAPNGVHDDCVISLAYAFHSIKKKNNNYVIGFA